MNSTYLFEMALNLQKPWKIKDVKFEEKPTGQELHISIDLSPSFISGLKKVFLMLKYISIVPMSKNY
tara:strand:- start:639 stop:839 length:201 start_codon:yes stop_codon:yes gene_type:complete